jgi:hypothetical protein
LAAGSQDGATNLLNVYYHSPVAARGTVDKVRVYSQAVANNTFTVFLLRPVGDGLSVIRQQQFVGNGESGQREFSLDAAWDVQRGDLFAHWGNGGPTFGKGQGTKDVIYYPLGSKPKTGEMLSVAKLPKIASRSYALQYEFNPATPAADAKFIKPAWSADGATLTLRLRWQGTAPPEIGLKISATSIADPLGGGSAALDAKIAEIVRTADRSDKQKQELFDYFVGQDDVGKKLKQQVDSHQKARPKKPTALSHVMIQGNPRRTNVHVRGNFLEKGAEVQPAGPASLPPLEPRGDRPDRLDLARWIVSPENPLTARVVVNQIWGELFGQGLVRTADDFGTQGELPSHPELLDWLASEFQRLGWSRKKLIRMIVTSETYQQASQTRDDIDEKDPENRLLARQNRFRLPAELVRDQFLAASGLLNDQIGGPSFRPPLPESVTRIQFTNNWKADAGDALYRRGLYIHLQRNLMLPMLSTFDRPEAILSCSRRVRSNTPLQALTLLNGAVFVQASQELAMALLSDGGLDDSRRVDRLFRRVVCRPPSDFERERVQRLVKQVSERYEKDPAIASELLGPGFASRLNGISPTEAAAWVVACRTVLNLDEVITRE